MDALVVEGPVLDVPVGTGRYGAIYATKGLSAVGVDLSPDMLAVARRRYPRMDLREGSVFDLPFGDGHFTTAVCTRLLDWLPPADMRRALAELRRVARRLVVTVRHGPPACRVNWTHSLSEFYGPLDGLHVADRRVTETTGDGVEEIMLLRPPEWRDVYAALAVPDAEFADVRDELQRLVCPWLRTVLGTSLVDVGPGTCDLEARFLSRDQLCGVLDWMAQHDWAYATDEEPRWWTGSVLLLRVGSSSVVLDGRRRLRGWGGEVDVVPTLCITLRPEASAS